MAVDNKALMTVGLFSQIFGNGLILPVDETKFNPNGILPGEWGHYDTDGTTWISGTPEVLTVVGSNTSIIKDGVMEFTGTGTGSGGSNLRIADSISTTHATPVHAEGGTYPQLLYSSGVKLNSNDTKSLYKWIRKI